MAHQWVSAAAAAGVLLAAAAPARAQENREPDYRAETDLVTVTFRAADAKGRPIRGLTAGDVRIFEDGIPQKIAFFTGASGRGAGTSIFILFDTSNRMYDSFPYVHDSISAFIRSLDPADSVAVYAFSRNLFRAATLTLDHERAKAGLYNTVAGDETALFNAILLTVRDAAAAPGRKAIVVFSNGPDNASMVSPYDVGKVAEDEDIPIYLISSTGALRDPAAAAAIQSLTERTGGTLYYANNWRQQAGVFASVREDIGNSYVASYYPAPNPNEGFRRIRVEIAGPAGRARRVWSRAGYNATQKIASPAKERRRR